jgi:hypothetical protein
LQRLEADGLETSDHKKVLRIQAKTKAKLAPKYRGPSGETWAGRGLKPKWLQSLIKESQKPYEFTVNQPAASLKRSIVKKSRRKGEDGVHTSDEPESQIPWKLIEHDLKWLGAPFFSGAAVTTRGPTSADARPPPVCGLHLKRIVRFFPG